jgi:hypothetical protein
MKILLLIIIITVTIWYLHANSEAYINKLFLTSPLVQREFSNWKLINEDVSPSEGRNPELERSWIKLESSKIFNKESVFVDTWLKWIRIQRKYKFVIIPYIPTKYSKNRHVYSEMYAYVWVSQDGSKTIKDNSENKMYMLI